MEPGLLVFPNKFDPNPAWLCPNPGAGLAPKAGVDAPNSPPLLAGWLLPNRLPPPNAGAVCAPNAGVDAAPPNAGEDAPNAGVLCPNIDGDDAAPNVVLPNKDAEDCPNGDGDDPNAGLELACPNAAADAAPNAGVLDPNVLVPNAGDELCPKAGAGVLGLPNVGLAENRLFVDANGLGLGDPNVLVAAPNGLDVAEACCCEPKMPPAAGWGLAGFGPPLSPAW